MNRLNESTMAILFLRFWIVLSLLIIQGMLHDLWSQVVRPETVFRQERIAGKGISVARITTAGRMNGQTSEFYHFQQNGHLVAIIANREHTSDTLLGRNYDHGKISDQQESRAIGLRKEVFSYDEYGRMPKKVVLVDDTLFSEVLLSYDSTGLLLFSAEITAAGDTLRSARYTYHNTTLVAIHYRGAKVGRIEYFRQGKYNVSRVFSTDERLLLTRTEKYRRDRLLKKEILSVPGIGTSPPTIYRYRFGLLRKIIHPDGSKSRVMYFTAKDSFPALGRKLFSGHHQFLSE